MQEAKFQLSLSTPPQAQYAKGHMLNIRADSQDELRVSVEEARELPALAPFFVGIPANDAQVVQQAVQQVQQQLDAQPVAPAPVAQPQAAPAPPPVQVQPPPQQQAQPQAAAGICPKCGVQMYMREKKDRTGFFPACPNWKPSPTPGTLEHK